MRVNSARRFLALGSNHAASWGISLRLSSSDNLRDADLKLLEGNPNVFGVALPYTRFSVTVAGIASLARIPNLQELWIKNADAAKFAEVTNCKNLEVLRLDLAYSPPGTLNLLGKLRKLQVLELECSTEALNAAITTLQKHPELTTLHLDCGELSPQQVAGLAGLPKLRSLTLESYGDLNTAVAGLPALKNLRELTLDGEKFTNAGLEHLKSLNKLELLDLFETKVVGAAEVTGIKSLRWVQLPKEQIQQVQAFKTARPDVRTYNKE